MDHEVSDVVERCFLQVNNHYLTLSVCAILHNLRWNADTHAGSQTKHDIGLSARFLSLVEQVLVVVLAEVEDGVAEVAVAVLALSTSLVKFRLILCPYPIVPQLVRSTLLANLQVGVSVQLGDFAFRDAGFEVQAVYILRDNIFADVSLHQL